MNAAIDTAETAYIQGHDLWKAEQVRLVPAMEFHSRFLLLKKSHDTNQTLAEHYETLLNDKGTNDPPRPSTPAPSYVCSGAGVHLSLSPTMEVGFNAYHNRMGIALPTTERHIDTQVRTMQDPGSQLIFMYETLTHGAASK